MARLTPPADPRAPREPTGEELTRLTDAIEHAWAIHNGADRWRKVARAAWPLAYAAGFADAQHGGQVVHEDATASGTAV